MRACLRVAPVLLLLAFVLPVSARTLYYRIDPVHTQILFSVDHDGYSHPVGRMKIKAGWLRFDESDWSTAKVVADVDAASVDFGDKDWNDAVTGKRFLDAKEFPLAHFESTSVEKQDAQHGTLKGNLSLRGVTREIAIPFTLNRVGATIFSGMQTLAGFSAQTTLDRLQFGMTAFPKAVGTQVGLHLEVEAVLDQDAEKNYDAHSVKQDSGNAAAQH
ncbi:MAG TPA: YceI family protein [Rhodanobacteraceae bacterium]|nr:YceI family protein [Rhodanobacteraceae bacterium]